MLRMHSATHSTGTGAPALKPVDSASPMIRIHCATFDDVDRAWQLLLQEADETFQPVELHLDRHGPLYTVIRDATGLQSSQPLPHSAGQQGHSSPGSTPA